MSLTGRLYGIGPWPVRHLDVPVRQSPVEVLVPYGPDRIVFGGPKPPLERDLAYGPPTRTCKPCQVQWTGDGPCWCCGGRNRND